LTLEPLASSDAVLSQEEEAGVALMIWWRNYRFSYFKDGIIYTVTLLEEM
jgi:hypothetical protein